MFNAEQRHTGQYTLLSYKFIVVQLLQYEIISVFYISSFFVLFSSMKSLYLCGISTAHNTCTLDVGKRGSWQSRVQRVTGSPWQLSKALSPNQNQNSSIYEELKQKPKQKTKTKQINKQKTTKHPNPRPFNQQMGK